MPKIVVPLTDITIKNAKAKGKPYKLADGGGLYLEVMPTGSKLWRMKFRQANGKESRLAFGIYPQTTLVQARNKRDEARKLKSNGIDPGQAKKERDRSADEEAAQTFERVARDWHSNKLASWHPTTAKDTLRRLEIDIFPQIGALPIVSITHQHMITALRKIEARGAQEVAHRVKATCAQVFSYANQQGNKNGNPAADLADVLKPVQPGHFAAITVDELPDFLAAMTKNDARLFLTTRTALRLMMLLFMRTSELITTP